MKLLWTRNKPKYNEKYKLHLCFYFINFNTTKRNWTKNMSDKLKTCSWKTNNSAANCRNLWKFLSWKIIEVDVWSGSTVQFAEKKSANSSKAEYRYFAWSMDRSVVIKWFCAPSVWNIPLNSHFLFSFSCIFLLFFSVLFFVHAF